jgi:hypothetical protein
MQQINDRRKKHNKKYKNKLENKQKKTDHKLEPMAVGYHYKHRTLMNLWTQ